MRYYAPPERFDWEHIPCPLLGEKIREARVAAGLSIREMARRIEVDWSLVYNWENGHLAVSRRHFRRLSDLFRGGSYDWAAVEARAQQRNRPPMIYLKP